MITLQLQKPDSLFIVRYEPGDEPAVMDHLIECVNARRLSWFDAATLSHQVGQHLRREMKERMK